MQSKAKKYGEYVEITAPVERTTSEEYPTYWAEKSGTTRIQAKKYYRKAKLQEISRKS